MALFAKSKVDRFQEEPPRSSLGPGDYDPCVPQTNGNGAGAVSLGFTSSKGLPTSPKEEPIPEESESNYGTAIRDRRASTSVGVASSSRRLSIGSPRTAPSLAMTRQEKAEAQQQAKQLSWSELEREKLQAEVAKLRLREVSVFVRQRGDQREKQRKTDKQADSHVGVGGRRPVSVERLSIQSLPYTERMRCRRRALTGHRWRDFYFPV